MASSIDPQGYAKIYTECTYSTIDELTAGPNKNKFVCLKVFGVISHSNQIPL